MLSERERNKYIEPKSSVKLKCILKVNIIINFGMRYNCSYEKNWYKNRFCSKG